VVREAIVPEGYSDLSARLRPGGHLVHVVHVVVRADAGGVIVVTSTENGPAEAISVVVWSAVLYCSSYFTMHGWVATLLDTDELRGARWGY
jgi:hypothetical protein